MGMKKATRDRITAAYDKGFVDGELSGHDRAEDERMAHRDAEARRLGSWASFAKSLEKESEPGDDEDA